MKNLLFSIFAAFVLASFTGCSSEEPSVVTKDLSEADIQAINDSNAAAAAETEAGM